MEAGMRSWVSAVAATVLLAGCGTALARPGSGLVHPVGTTVTEPAHPHSGDSPIGGSCPVLPGWSAITVTDTVPVPVVTVPPGARIVVILPRWGWGTATDVDVAHGGILREKCTVLLPGGGRRTIFLAAGQGGTRVGATVQPASNLFMPAWGGEVIVRGTPGLAN
jgi:hypothetical protein